MKKRVQTELDKRYKQSSQLAQAAYDGDLKRMLELLSDFANPDSKDTEGRSAIAPTV